MPGTGVQIGWNAQQQDIFRFDPTSAGAVAYQELINELATL
jgi:hypothetical protein